MVNPWDSAPIIQPAPKKAPAAAPRRHSPETAKAILRKSDAVLNEGIKKLTAAQQKKAFANYYASPLIQRLRRDAGLPTVRTREEELQAIAKKKVAQQNTGGIYGLPVIGKPLKGFSDFTDAAQAGFSEALFGVPERLMAGADYLLGNNPGTRNLSENLTVVRAETEARKDKSTTGNVLGQIIGAVQGGQAATGLIRGGGQLVAKAAPRAGNAIQRLTILEKGKRGANAAKIVAGGAAAGGAQAAGEGTDVSTGTITGAVAAPLAVGGLKGAEWLTRPVRDFLRMSSAKSIVERQIPMSFEALQKAAARFRKDTGREPTVYEILPTADRQAVSGMIKKMPDAARENVSDAVRARVAAMPGELVGRTEELTAGQQRFMAAQIARELAESRGATRATADELALAKRATRDPTEMEMVRRTVDKNIMGPIDNKIAYEKVDDLIPVNPVNKGNGVIGTEIADDQIAATIRGAAGTLRLSPEGVKVQDVTRIISRLRQTADRGGIEGDAAQRSINHLEDILARDHPDVSAAMARMTQAHASRSQMLKAIPEGRATRLREDVPVETGRAARGVRQSYDTPEGAAGRAIGQRAELLTDFSGTPKQAIARAGQIADSPGTQESIRRNLGAEAGDGIARAASTQAESLRRLSALRQPVKGDEGDLDFGDLAMSMSLISPTALIRTKSQAVGTLLRLISGIPEGRANQIVEALFSQKPSSMAAAAKLLTSAGEDASRALRDIVASVSFGAQASSLVGGVDQSRTTSTPEGVPDPVPVDDTPIDEQNPWDAAPVFDEEAHYGRRIIETLFPEAEITQDNRDPNSELGRKNPDSFHNHTNGAVDLRPIPGMTFDEFIQILEDEGHVIIEAIDEVNNPSGHATGEHWHVVFG